MGKRGNICHKLLLINIGGASIFTASCVTAQITPDRTLPSNSNVTVNGSVFNITGGTQAGRNLFHSFQTFSVPSGGTASFNNGVDVQNIFSRVTGGTISNINGIIKTSGNANLFIINPSGIVFGPNASLNVGGCFVATTANAIQFGNQGSFSASVPNNPAILTINPSALFYNQITAASIQNNSTAPTGLNSSGLRVPDGKSLLLVGGNVNMDGGRLNAYGGRIELGGLASTGTVVLEVDGDNFRLGFPASSARADVSLANKSSINVQAGGGGNIAVNARNLEVSGGSVLNAGIGRGLGSINSIAGDITLDATGEIKVIGEQSSVLNTVRSQAVGNGGNLTVNTHELLVQDGAQVGATTFGVGKSGNLKINADTVEVIGTSTVDGSPSSLTTQSNLGAIGNAGDLTITTKTLRVQDGAQVFSGTFSAGKAGNMTITTKTLLVQDGGQIATATVGAGNAGNMTVNADTVEITGTNAVDDSPSGLFANADQANLNADIGATGNGGNITINSNQLLVQDRALIFAGARSGRKSPSNGGDITINTQKLLLQKGGQVGAGTRGAGRGGNVNVKANSIELNGFPSDIYSDTDSTGDAGNLTISTKILTARDGGQVSTGTAGTGKGGTLTVNADIVQLSGISAEGFRSGLFSSTTRDSTGAAGDLKINAQQLLVTDKAKVFVTSLGLGNAGNLSVNARSISLDNNSIVSANTRSINTNSNRQQATIDLQVKNLLLLSRGSSITTNARGENVTGGDININTNILAATGNSDITANSTNFRGGRIKIESQSLFGAQYRNPPSPQTSDITARGKTPELNGSTQVNTLDIDPTRGLATLPINLLDAQQQISSACAPSSRQSQNIFVATGRGGLPLSPTEPLQDSETLSTWVRLKTQQENLTNTNTQSQSAKISNHTKIAAVTTPIVPATGWVFDGKGNVHLIAQGHEVNPHVPSQTPAMCPASH